MNLEIVSTALLTVGVPVSHYEAVKKPDKYIVWAEDGAAGSSWADGKLSLQVLSGTIDYFTKTEYDPNFDAIQSALGGAGISFRLNSIQHEEDTGYNHYEWVFGVL
jgi:hypothetical protein